MNTTDNAKALFGGGGFAIGPENAEEKEDGFWEREEYLQSLDPFAKAAMQSFILKAPGVTSEDELRAIALQSYKLARIMLEARSKVK